jgi:RimJ/RimL family protein N-acetyltransferase
MDVGHKTSDVARAAARHHPRVRIRPLEPADAVGVAALFDRLSAESRRRRFLTPKLRLSPQELRHLTNVDHVRHEALAAIDDRDGSIVGIARYVEFSGRPRVADVALEVADDLQGTGIGTMLARRLVDRARANGMDKLEATTLWENRAARSVCRRLGFHARASHGTEIELELMLSAPAAHVPPLAAKGATAP